MATVGRLRWQLLPVTVLVGLLVACSSSSPTAAPASTTSVTSTRSTTTASADTTVWLCRPGIANDPCEASTASTTITAANALSVVPNDPDTTKPKPVDCFYVYPTVTTQPGPNADLTVEAAEVKVAQAQASRFSSVCNVWAPMYRQATLPAMLSGPGPVLTAYASLHSAWEDYLQHDNGGRPIVFLGHSQGTAMLIDLLQRDVDPDAALRARIVSALLLGGNVQVPIGKDVGGTFQHIPACRSTTQTGCVIAYSTFPSQPPPYAVFGIPGQGVSLLAGQTERSGVEVLCTNPADLSDNAASSPLLPYFWIAGRPSRQLVSTDWVAFPSLYTAECHDEKGASWLQVDDIGGGTDVRPRLQQTSGAAWGFHAADVNVALGNLVDDVKAQVAAYLAAHPG